MEKRKKHLLSVVYAGMMLICVLVFVWLTLFMSSRTEETINEIGDMYMDTMNVQLQQKFETIIELRLEQVASIINRTPPASEYSEEILQDLRISAEVRNFTSLAFLRKDGTSEVLYGENPKLVAAIDVEKILKENGNLVTSAVAHSGEKILVLGKPAAYRMKDGEYSDILMIGLPMEYLNDAMFLNEDDTKLYSHVIDGEGNFVIRNGDAYVNNYFVRLARVVEEADGKGGQDYSDELRAAMASKEDYSAKIIIDGEQRQIYCSPVSDVVDWYLVTIMSDNILREAVRKLDQSRLGMILSSYLVIVLGMLCIFIIYFKFSQKQIAEINKAKEEALHANKAKSEFLSNMSHDIRTPMNAIIGMTEIAMKSTNDPAKLNNCLQKIRLSSKHLLGLINDVLDMSKIESGKATLNMVPMSLRDAVDDIVNIMQPQVKAGRQYFDVFIQQITHEKVYCDGMRLNQVLLNLLSNAVKFTPGGGRIDIYISQEDSPRGEEYVRTHFRVTDTGIGMSPEFQKKIFETFTREENEKVYHITGTGLGMSITKSIVDLMGGTIELHSEQGKGSDFHIILDLKKVDTDKEEVTLPSWKALVVDDDESLCLSAAENLKELGLQAEWTTDGMKAVEMVEENHRKGEDYHFVLVDWKMPEMDGVQTIHEIRKRVESDTSVFLISAYDWNDIAEDIDSDIISGFIGKPLFKSTLYEYLKQYVDGHEQSESSQNLPDIDFTGKHILIAEDIDLNWEVVSEILSSVGLELDRAENGQKCVEIFEKSELGYYDAILMDIRMPVMNGYDATLAIKALDRPDKDLPIIAMTADAFSDDAKQCLEYGMVAHIPKPIDIRECMRVLQKYLQ